MANQANTKTHWKKHFNPNYLGSYSLEPGQELVATIIELKDEEVTSPDGNKEVLPVLYLKDQKPMILNKTNAKAIAKVCGSDYVEEWPGNKIQIYSAPVKAFGQVTQALRVRTTAPKKEKLTAERFTKMVKAIEANQYDKLTALETFDLTPEQIKKIQSL
jgi:hypothetical protein